MAAPATPASPSRDAQIKAKEDAIKRKLAKDSSGDKAKALKLAQAKAKLAPGTGKKFTAQYTTKNILGEDKGFSKSDYGVGAGAAIPYQIGSGRASVSATATKPKPKPKPKPRPPAAVKNHSTYKVKRGDTLSGIAKKHGTDWKTIWDYNLKNRKSGTVKTMKKRGPNLIFRGGTFYIPKR
jgi:nucleoid-associated protein YgaU